jgi:hypothetical protein
MYRLPYVEILLGLGPHPDFRAAGVDQIVDDLTEEDPVRDLAGQDCPDTTAWAKPQRKIP